MVVDKITEIRRLTPAEKSQIAAHLDRNDGWKKLMRIIPRIVEIDGEVVEKGFKYGQDSERLIQNASDKERRPGEILFDEWGCSGKFRPTIELLLALLVKAELFRAADFVAVNLLNEQKPERPKTGPARVIDITLPPDEETIEVNKIMSQLSYPNSSRLVNGAYLSASTLKNKDFYEKLGHDNVNKVTVDPNDISDMIQFSKTSVEVPTENNENLIPIPPPRRQRSSSKISNSNNLSSEINIPSLSALQFSVNSSSSVAPIPNLDLMINSDNSSSEPDTDSSISSESSNFTLPNVSREIPQLSILQQSQSQLGFMPNLSEFNVDPEEEEFSSPKEISYADIALATDNFNEIDFKKNGRKIGSGGFGVVYLAEDLVRNVKFSAVKKLGAKTYKCQEKFDIEINNLSNHSHENIVKLLGYCRDPEYCLIYEYIEGGNLLERLQNCRRGIDKLMWRQRIEISMGCANGICFLHEIGLIHRDIKSANILLKGTVPKLCDFGLMKQTDSVTTTAIIGTHSYMAPEGLRGDTSEKLDIYSLGVVILELVTGLAVLDKNRSSVDLLTYVQEMLSHSSNIPSVLIDYKAGTWNDDNNSEKTPIAAEKFFDVALKCFKEKARRPNIEIVKDMLNSIYSDYC